MCRSQKYCSKSNFLIDAISHLKVENIVAMATKDTSVELKNTVPYPDVRDHEVGIETVC